MFVDRSGALMDGPTPPQLADDLITLMWGLHQNCHNSQMSLERSWTSFDRL